MGAIVPGGAADVDGRLQVGDEISHINGLSVIDAPHQMVISSMGEAAAQGEVVIKIRRKMPVPGQDVMKLNHNRFPRKVFYNVPPSITQTSGTYM